MALAASLTPAQLAALPEGVREELAEAVERYELSDPVLFARRVLGYDPWDRQSEILRAVRDFDRVAVRSGHKIGKSTSAATLALWWFHTRPRALVIMTSATDDQVRQILWAELSRLYRAAGDVIGGDLHESHRVGLTARDGRRVIGIGTDKGERMAGFSGSDLLFVVDEASGVEDAIFDAIEGNRAGGAHIVMFGNPTRQSGRFYEVFHGDGPGWKLMHVSSEETPNVREGRVVIPGLATRSYIEEKRVEWGERHPEYQIRIRGDFPDSATDAVIGLDIAAASFQKWRAPEPGDGPLEVGVDVARFGEDESVIFARRGNYAYPPVVMHGANLVAVSGEVRRVCRDFGARGERVVVRVDGSGVGGGVVDILRSFRDLAVVDANASHSSGTDEHARLRDRLWFGLRDWLRRGGKLPADRKLSAELVAPTYSYDLKGRMKVESKDDIRDKLRPRRSPDRADALALAVHVGSGSASGAYDSPYYLDEAPDPDELAIRRRLDEICSGG